MKVMTALFGPTDAIERAHACVRRCERRVHIRGAVRRLHSADGRLDRQGSGCDVQRRDRFPAQPDSARASGQRLQLLAQGRFILGLGTQVRAQIEKRYGAEFDRPVARMKEMVGALRAIFATWNDGERLDFRGEYYRHTLMTPTFNPGPNPFGPPPIYSARWVRG